MARFCQKNSNIFFTVPYNFSVFRAVLGGLFIGFYSSNKAHDVIKIVKSELTSRNTFTVTES